MSTSTAGISRPFDRLWGPRPGPSTETIAVPGPGVAENDGPARRALRFLMRNRASLLVTIHVAVFAAVFPLAYLLRFDGAIPGGDRLTMVGALPWVILLKLAVFLALRGHRGWWRYATFADVVVLAEATTLATVAVVTAGYLFRFGVNTPRSVIVLDWAGTLMLLGGMRCSTRLLRERYYPMIATRKSERALVVGATEEGLRLVRLIQSQFGPGLKVVGLLDADRKLLGRTLGGVRVIGSTADVARLAEKHQVKTVLAPTPAVAPREIRALVTDCNKVGVKVQIVPGFDALLSGSVTVQPRDVDIHDLLCREPVKFNDDSVAKFLRGRVVLVTGAAGSIGSEICRQVLAFRPSRLVLLDHSENGLFFVERELRGRAGKTELVTVVASITDPARVRATFERHHPAVVFHAAAHKHVPMMESNPGEAVKNNVFGTRTLVDEATRAKAEAFVMISTDKAVRASSVMGACKRLAEMYVQARSKGSSTRLVTVRFGNVLGSAGSVVPIFKEQIHRGGPVTVTHPEMTRYFMTIPEATQLVLQAGALGSGGEIFVLDMGEPVRVLDLARDMIRLSGLTEGREIDIAFTGLRPGEKLHEELYNEQEEPLPTPLPKISIARHRPYDIEWVETQLERLARTVDNSSDEVKTALRAAVPEYRPPSHSATAPGVHTLPATQPLPNEDLHPRSHEPAVTPA